MGSPSITFIGDENTGLYRKGSGSVGFVSDATEIANFDSNGITISSGNIIIPDSIIHSGDPNTKIRFSDTDEISLETDGVQRLKVDGTEVVFNETGADVDFRVEGDTAANLFKVDASADKVGIGVASPIEILHTNGAIISVASSSTSGTTGAKRALLDLSGNQCRVGHFRGGVSSGSGSLGLYTESTEKVRIDTSGNVGIGTTSPSQLLSLSSSDPRIVMTETTNNSNCIFDYASGGVLEVSVDDNDVDSNSKFQVRIDGATAGLTLDGTGLGIGTTSPTYRTEVTVSDTTAYSLSATNSTQHQLRINNAGLGGVAGILLTAEPSSGSAGHAGIRVISPSSGNANMTFSVRDGGTYSEKLRIQSDGKVGIGTTSPAALLTLNQTIPELRLQSSNNNLGMGDFIGLISLHTSDGSTPGAGEVFRIKTESSSSIGADYTTRLYNRNGVGGGATEISLGNGQGSIYLSTNTAGNATAAVKMVVMSSGNVGIGTTSPDALLHTQSSAGDDFEGLRIINSHADANAIDTAFIRLGVTNTGGIKTTQIAAVQEGNNSNAVALRFGTNSSGSNNGETEKMRILGSGYVGIGTTTPQAKLQVDDTNPVIAEFYRSDGGTNDEARIALGALSSNIPSQRGVQLAAVNNGAGHDFSIRTSPSASLGPTEKMKVTSDGTIFLSSNTNTAGGGSATWYVSGSQQQCFRGNQGDYIHFKTTSGTGIGRITNISDSSTNYNTSSDYRLKENQTAISDGITRLKTLKPYRFNWKSDTSRIVDGFFAHEVTAVPESVSGTKDAIAVQEDVDEGRATNVGDPVYQSIDHSKLVPLLTAALQEAVAKIETLETKVATLEAA